jgi:hypothetical protein
MPIECRSTTYFIGDPDILSKTCKNERTNERTAVKLRFVDIVKNSTTICITPLIKDAKGHTEARFRTMKAMQACVAGIPIVSPAWVDE